MSQSTLLEEIISLPADWHALGGFDPKTARAIVNYCRGRHILSSAETGAGKSTLLFSHLSKRHIVFAIDEGGSLDMALKSPLLRREAIELVEGPTQKTLPGYTFPRLQLALIDGPHAYPFPDMEYYYIYPHLDEGALLIIDDIDIPTINNLYGVIAADRMFRPLSLVGKTAFFERTSAPTFDPFTGWWLEQGYNKRKRIVDWSISAMSRGALHQIKIMTPPSFRSIIKRIIKGS
jgi:hypothetical protein